MRSEKNGGSAAGRRTHIDDVDPNEQIPISVSYQPALSEGHLLGPSRTSTVREIHKTSYGIKNRLPALSSLRQQFTGDGQIGRLPIHSLSEAHSTCLVGFVTGYRVTHVLEAAAQTSYQKATPSALINVRSNNCKRPASPDHEQAWQLRRTRRRRSESSKYTQSILLASCTSLTSMLD